MTRELVPPVDARRVNPAGFVSAPRLGNAALAQAGTRWAVQVGSDRVRFARSGQVTAADVARLRQLRTVTIDWGSPDHPDQPSHPAHASHASRSSRSSRPGRAGSAAVRVVAGLAAAGVPLRAAHVPSWAGALGDDLTALLTAMDERDLADDLRREEHSVRLRRAALRAHSSLARRPDPAVSVILCTRRPDFLGFALTQLAHQREVDLELVLTLHGVPADLPEVAAAIAEFDRPITVVEVPADVPFGTALDRGVARSSGRYVAKWDDDDWYGRDFLADMLLAAAYSGAELVGCTAQFVYLAQIDLTIYRVGRSERESRWISGGTFVMKRSAFDDVGGFPPVPRHVDKALLDALLEGGARTYCTHGLGYALHRRATGHTWNEPVTYFLRQAAGQWRGQRFGAFIDPADIALPRTAAGSR